MEDWNGWAKSGHWSVRSRRNSWRRGCLMLWLRCFRLRVPWKPFNDTDVFTLGKFNCFFLYAFKSWAEIHCVIMNVSTASLSLFDLVKLCKFPKTAFIVPVGGIMSSPFMIHGCSMARRAVILTSSWQIKLLIRSCASDDILGQGSEWRSRTPDFILLIILC